MQPFVYYRASIPAGYYRLIGNLLAKLTAKISEAFAFMELKDVPVTARYLPDKDLVKNHRDTQQNRHISKQFIIPPITSWISY